MLFILLCTVQVELNIIFSVKEREKVPSERQLAC